VRPYLEKPIIEKVWWSGSNPSTATTKKVEKNPGLGACPVIPVLRR
jgi:hypothetical protein